MKANITLMLDAVLLREIRVLAAEEGTSISALVHPTSKEIVCKHRSRGQARKRALARLREGLDLQWTPTSSRDELHQP
jgi:hypothetical protein